MTNGGGQGGQGGGLWESVKAGARKVGEVAGKAYEAGKRGASTINEYRKAAVGPVNLGAAGLAGKAALGGAAINPATLPVAAGGAAVGLAASAAPRMAATYMNRKGRGEDDPPLNIRTDQGLATEAWDTGSALLRGHGLTMGTAAVKNAAFPEGTTEDGRSILRPMATGAATFGICAGIGATGALAGPGAFVGAGSVLPGVGPSLGLGLAFGAAGAVKRGAQAYKSMNQSPDDDQSPPTQGGGVKPGKGWDGQAQSQTQAQGSQQQDGGQSNPFDRDASSARRMQQVRTPRTGAAVGGGPGGAPPANPMGQLQRGLVQPGAQYAMPWGGGNGVPFPQGRRPGSPARGPVGNLGRGPSPATPLVQQPMQPMRGPASSLTAALQNRTRPPGGGESPGGWSQAG